MLMIKYCSSVTLFIRVRKCPSRWLISTQEIMHKKGIKETLERGFLKRSVKACPVSRSHGDRDLTRGERPLLAGKWKHEPQFQNSVLKHIDEFYAPARSKCSVGRTEWRIYTGNKDTDILHVLSAFSRPTRIRFPEVPLSKTLRK